MLRAVAVDDEIKALEWLGRIIKQEEQLSLVGSFTNPAEAFEFIKFQDVDVVFLDIEMPRINGLEFSENLFEIKPEIDVIFVTAYDKYALAAFQANAIGYMLKPIDLEDIKEQVRKIIKRKQAKKLEDKATKLNIQCLGRFLCFPQGAENESIGWKTSKAEELFGFLIHCQGKLVSKEKIINTLWPEMNREKASNNLYVTSYYIRDTLSDKGYNEMLIKSRGNYQINLRNITCDMLEFIKIIETLNLENNLKILEDAAALYNGLYFDDKPYEWVLNMRGWLETENEKLQLKLAKAYRISGETESASKVLRKMIYENPLLDEAYKALIELSIEQGDNTSAITYYKQYEKIMREELKISPPDYIKTKIENLMWN